MKNNIKIILAIVIIIIITGGIVVLVMNNGKDTESKRISRDETKANNSNEVAFTTTDNNTVDNNTVNNNNNTVKNETTNKNTTTDDSSKTEKSDYEKYAEKQMAKPEKGESIAVIHVKKYGDITVKFFDDVAPKAVENFKTHAKDGYYNGLIFHRVINEFMIQGGDPLGTGYGGESIWGKGFEEELSEEILPYRGSLCMASSGTGTSSLGSQFFITQAHYDEETAQLLKEYYQFPQGIIDMYKKYGGYMSLYQQYTVFGQVIEGMDVVDKIASTKTDSNDKTLEDVVIESIEIKEYK